MCELMKVWNSPSSWFGSYLGLATRLFSVDLLRPCKSYKIRTFSSFQVIISEKLRVWSIISTVCSFICSFKIRCPHYIICKQISFSDNFFPISWPLQQCFQFLLQFCFVSLTLRSGLSDTECQIIFFTKPEKISKNTQILQRHHSSYAQITQFFSIQYAFNNMHIVSATGLHNRRTHRKYHCVPVNMIRPARPESEQCTPGSVTDIFKD